MSRYILLIFIITGAYLFVNRDKLPQFTQPQAQPVAVVPITPINIPQQQPQPQVVELLFFTSPVCTECTKMEPNIKKLEQSGVKVVRINVQLKGADLWIAKYGIKGTPISVTLVNGIEVNRSEGNTSFERLREMTAQKVRGIVKADIGGFTAFPIPEPEQPAPSKPSPVIVQPDPIVVKPTPKPEPVVLTPINVTGKRGVNGWRLRVLYPEGEAVTLRRMFEKDRELASFGKKYGYEAISTRDSRFEHWAKYGYPSDHTSVVLVNNSNDVVYRGIWDGKPQSATEVLDIIDPNNHYDPLFESSDGWNYSWSYGSGGESSSGWRRSR